MAHTIKPVINNNGTSKEELYELNANVRAKLRELIELMTLALPHRRDYQTGGDYETDRAEASRRIIEAHELAAAYYQDAIAMSEGR